MPEFPPPTLIAIPAFILSFAWEWWAVKTGRACGRYETKDAITSLIMGTGSVVADTLTAVVAYTVLIWIWQYRVFDIPATHWSGLAVFVINDFFYYWKHRAMHRVRWFWMSHVTHHSSRHYNLTTALRQPWYGAMTGLFIIGAPMIWLGFHPAFVGFAGGLNLVYQYWIHTEAIEKTPRWFEAVFNTPSHHRVHHGRNARYLDANYAGVFIIWDRMFGTFVPELEAERVDYGLVTNLKSHNPIVVAYHELAALLADCWRDGLRPWRWIGRAISPPGWSPTGDHNTSITIKRAFLADHPDEVGTPGLPEKLLRERRAQAPALAE